MPRRVESNTELTPQQTTQVEDGLDQVHGKEHKVVPAGTGFQEMVGASVEGPTNIAMAFLGESKDTVGEAVEKYGENMINSTRNFLEGATNQVMVD